MGSFGPFLSTLGSTPALETDGQLLLRKIQREVSEIERLTHENRELLANIDLGRAAVQNLTKKNRALNQQFQLLSSAYEASLGQLNVDKYRVGGRMQA
jgi:predicted nuclease with TOPRIM domain